MGADGVLYASRGRPNPSGSATDALFLFHGNPAAAPVREIVAAPGAMLPGPPDFKPDRPFRLRLLHFNDLHGRLADVSEHASTPVFARIAGHIKQARENCASQPGNGLLVFAGGDDLIGSSFAELIGCRPSAFNCHPAYRLYAAAGVDAGVVGNHDLDWGLGMLALSVGQDATFPLLSANLVPAAGTEASGIYPAALFVVKGLRVGVIGLTTPAEIKHALPGEFTITDPLVAVGNLLPALQPLCDVLIVLSHLGYSLASASAVTAGAGDVELAQALPHGAVNLIIGGHTHSLLHESGFDPAQWFNGIPIVQAGAGGYYLGEVVVNVTPAGVAVTEARLHPVAVLADDAAFGALHVQPLAEQVQRRLCEPLGAVARRADAGSAGAKTELPRFVADALAARCRAAGFAVDFALVDASSVCAELPTDRPLTFGDLFRLAPYADSVVLRRFTPAQMRAFLDDNALRYNPTGWPVAEGEERGFVEFSREVYCRLEMDTANGQPRRYECTIAGRDLQAELAGRTRPYLIACSSFLRQLAHGWEREQRMAGVPLFDLHAAPEEQTGLALREALVTHVRETLGDSTEAK
jgi:5'-nucleotidase / UDP-sugar diphosphatase